MSRASTVAYNPTLTNYAHGLAPDISKGLADILAPEVVVPAGAGQFKAYDDDQAFRIYNTRRAMGGKSRRVEFEAEDPKYDCSPHGLEIAIDDAEKDRAGEDNVPRLEEAKTKVLVCTASLAREKRVLDMFEEGTQAVGGAGDWVDPDVDPIDELDGILADLATQTGQVPTDVCIGLPALQQLRKHPLVRARFPGAPVVSINAAAITSLLILQVNVHIGVLSATTVKPGKVGNKANMLGARIYALVNSANPTEYDPSAAKTFVTNRGGVRGVKKYRDEPHADILLVDWSEDARITGTKCVKRIDVTTGPMEVGG